MEAKINIANLLKDCPKGMELDCTMIDNVVFEKLDVRSSHHPIIIRRTDSKDSNTTIHLTKYGQYSDEEDYKCVIFPKGKTTWEGFHKPFEDGDIVAFDAHHLQIYIFKDKKENNTLSNCYLMLDAEDDELYLEDGMYYVTRFATEEEKQKLFDAIKAKGYYWNAETKTLEKLPKFKVGDRIKSIISSSYYTVVDIKNDQYFIKSDTEKYPYQVPFSNEINYKLVPDKFDIKTLKPFDSKVLVRDTVKEIWKPDFFGCLCDGDYCPYMVVGGIRWKCCIPFEGNEHLLGKTEDCGEYFKNW